MQVASLAANQCATPSGESPAVLATQLAESGAALQERKGRSELLRCVMVLDAVYKRVPVHKLLAYADEDLGHISIGKALL